MSLEIMEIKNDSNETKYGLVKIFCEVDERNWEA